MTPACIVILNGAPRSGKTSLARAIQASFEGVWMNLGVDAVMAATPEHLRPGIGLRPGGEAPPVEPLTATLYSALYDSIAAHSRLGLNVVADVGHHDSYSRSLGTLRDAARRLDGLPAWLVGVRCPLETILERRRATGYPDDPSPEGPVSRWQTAVHDPGIYDLEVDTSLLAPEACADRIRQLLKESPPAAFPRLRSLPAH